MKQLLTAMRLVGRMGAKRRNRMAAAAGAVLASPARLGLLAVFALPAVALAAQANEWVPPQFIGLLESIPLPFTPGANLFVFCLILGLFSGLAGGLGQVNSGFAVTPALMSFGVRGLLAVGTDLLANTAFSLTGLLARKKQAPALGKAATLLMLGAVPGALAAGFLLKIIHFDNPASCDALIALALALLFGAYSFNALLEFSRARKQAAMPQPEEGEEEEEEDVRREEEEDEEGFAPPPESMSGVDVEGKNIATWVFIVIGLGLGFLTGLAGTSAGLALTPVLCNWLPFPPATAATTGMSAMLFTSLAGGAGLFAALGLVAYTAVAGLVLGMVPGLAIGSLSATEANPVITRALFTAMVLGCFGNRLLGLPLALSRAGMLPFSQATAQSMDNVGLGFLMVPAGLLGLWLLAMFAAKLKALRDAHALSPLSHPKVLLMGSAPMALFLGLAVFLLAFSPLGATLLEKAQATANALVKHQADKAMSIAPKATPFRGKLFKITLDFPTLEAAEQSSVVLHRAGLQVVVNKKNLTVIGDTGRFMARLLGTSQALYANDADGAYRMLGLPAENGGYALWRALKVMQKSMAAQGMAEAAKMIGTIRDRALVPAYNFYETPTASLVTYILSGVGAGLGLLLAAFWWGGGTLVTMEVLGFAYDPAKRQLTPEELEKLEQAKRRREKEKEQKKTKKKKRQVQNAPPPAAAAKVDAEENKTKPRKKKKKKAPADGQAEVPVKKKKKKKAAPLDEAEGKPKKKKKIKKKASVDLDAPAPAKKLKKKAKKADADADAKPRKKKTAKKKPAKPVKLEL